MKEQQILAEIQAAQSAVADAVSDLSRLLRETQAVSRAEKTTISEALREAFDKLRVAREHLGILEELARGEDD